MTYAIRSSRSPGVKKVYAMGANKVFALRGVDLTVGTGRDDRRHGQLGIRQVDAHEHSWMPRRADRRQLRARRRQGERHESRTQLADLRNQKLGFVFQGFNLLARTTAIDNVELPLLYDRSGRKLDTRKLATEALSRVGLGDRLDHQPSELSGGQQQRVAIARALVTQPTLLLADEPTGNLDSRTTVEVMALFQELNDQGITIVLVTHEPDVAQYAKRIVEVRDGRILRDHPVVGRQRARRTISRRSTRRRDDDDDASDARARGGSMKQSTLLKVASQSILKNKMRTLLTMLGIVIGVGAVIVMVAVGNGAQTMIAVADQQPRHEPHHRHAGLGQHRRCESGRRHVQPADGRRRATSSSARQRCSPACRRSCRRELQVIGGQGNWRTMHQRRVARLS